MPAGRGSSITEAERKTDLSLEDVKTSVVSREGETINVSSPTRFSHVKAVHITFSFLLLQWTFVWCFGSVMLKAPISIQLNLSIWSGHVHCLFLCRYEFSCLERQHRRCLMKHWHSWLVMHRRFPVSGSPREVLTLIKVVPHNLSSSDDVILAWQYPYVLLQESLYLLSWSNPNF